MALADIKEALDDLSRLTARKVIAPLPERNSAVELDISGSFRVKPRTIHLNASNVPLSIKETIIETCIETQRRSKEMDQAIEVSPPEYGYIYALEHPSETAKKVGRSDTDPFRRAKNLNTARADGEFRVLYCQWVPDHIRVEILVHKLLDKFRVDSRREFFDCSLEMIMLAVKTAVVDLHTT